MLFLLFLACLASRETGSEPAQGSFAVHPSGASHDTGEPQQTEDDPGPLSLHYSVATGGGIAYYGFTVDPDADSGTMTISCPGCIVPLEVHNLVPVPIQGGGTAFESDLDVVDAVDAYDPATTTTWTGLWFGSGTMRFDAALGDDHACITWGYEASLLGTDCEHCWLASGPYETTGGYGEWNVVDDCSP